MHLGTLRILLVLVSVVCLNLLLSCGDDGGDLNGGTDTDGDTDTDTDSDTDTDADCDPAGTCCNIDGTVCEHGCDGTNCWSDCAPSDNCCGPNGTFKTNEVQQSGTNLYWRSCPIGQTWDDIPPCGCIDDPEKLLTDWCYASGVDAPNGSGGYYCQSDHDGTDICAQTYPSTGWRLPTAEEYSVLLEETGLGNYDGKNCNGTDGNTMCTDMFGYDSRYYWSSSSFDDSAAWLASFNLGYVYEFNKHDNGYVRCVRSGSEVDGGT
ncbi:MAG: DUF1566 domain-containing protein [Planctomycetes bacterium]|nr:DUF1566 domain-containing protein [Planctomycetota bacterium]